MQITLFGKQRPVWVAALGIVALTALLYAQYLLFWTRELTLIAAVAMALLFARGDLKRLWNLPCVLLLGYVAYTAVSAFWAMAGKFFLNQFVRLFPAAVVFVALVLRGRADRVFARRVMAVIADVSALVALMSVEGASTGLLKYLAADVLSTEGIQMLFSGSRMYGAFGNSNIEAAIAAIGVFLSLALLTDAEDKRERALRAATLAFNAFAFVLALSLGAMACFAAAVVVYLIAAGAERGKTLALMLAAAVPTLVCSFAAARFFTYGTLKLLPLLMMLLDAAAVIALDRTVAEKLGKVLAAHEKTLYGALLAVAALLAVYALLAMRLSAPHTFSGYLNRGMAVAPGEHTLQIDADNDLDVTITSVNSVQVLTGDPDQLYSGSAAAAVFTVPADSLAVEFSFFADTRTTIRSAAIDGETPIMLRYRLLPDFIAKRLQGTLAANSSVALRLSLWKDGLKLWRLSPVVGNGLGSYETGLSRVQGFDYETKFPHNHYIQVLLEGGVIGLALFLGAHIALGAALWKRRRVLREGEFAALGAAFAAQFTMNALQMLWDIQMTNTTFLVEIYAFYALVVLLCAEPLGQAKRAETPETAAAGAAKTAPKGGKGRKKAAARDGVRPEIRAACMLLPIFVGVTFLGNIIGQHLLYDFPDTLDVYFNNLELGMKIDLYEYNDFYATYLEQAADYQELSNLTQANKYAEQLASRPSNSSSLLLAEYYINTQQFSKALDAALQGTVYSASDTGMWNSTIDLLKQCFANTSYYSPLLGEDGDELLAKLLAYRAAWVARGETALEPVELTYGNMRFFEELLALEACGGDRQQIYEVLTFYQPVPQNVKEDA